MKPPYDLTPEIVKLIAAVSAKIGEVNANFLSKPSPQLRKQNRIRTIHSSLGIEGNTLSIEQVTALLEDKIVLGPPKDITEVQNAIEVYEHLSVFGANDSRSFLHAHQLLMSGLLAHPGKYRTKSVGIMQGKDLRHVAPPAENVSYLMNDLFAYLENDDEHVLIKSCVFHYEMEFIHPFADGNGRMGRLWQTLILMQEFPVFEFLPFETMIGKEQEKYYRALAASDAIGKSTPFIEYMLDVIDRSLSELLSYNNRTLTDTDRLEYFLHLGHTEFTRKDYMNVFKDISSATASRDLKKGVEEGLLEKEGELNRTTYKVLQSLN